MSLGDGEYLVISTCINKSYNFNNIALFLTKLKEYNIEFGEACLLDVKPENTTYELLWNGNLDELNIIDFSIENLTNKFLSTLEIIFKNGIVARFQTNFLDEECYEVSLLFNYTQLIEEELAYKKRIGNASFVENIALLMFEKLSPVYGVIGVEKSVASLKLILSGEEFLPLERGFYCKELMNEGYNFYSKITDNHTFIKDIPNVGLCFRKSSVDDFTTKNVYEEKFDFSEALKVLKNISSNDL